MFQIYNENMKLIPLPTDVMGYGLAALDLTLSSTAQDVTEHNLPGWPGTIDTAYQDSDREMSISVRLKAKNPIDFRIKRDAIYAYFKRLGTFYIAENHQPNKLMRVRVVESFSFSRPENNRTFATAEIPLRIVGQPYWISKFKTVDLKSMPMVESWNIGLGIDPNKLDYQFTNQSSFNVYNGGTVPIKTIQEVDNCIITITVNQTVTNFKLYDTSGKYFEYNPLKDTKWNIASGTKLIISGHRITLNNTPVLDRTNRYFLLIQPGDNNMRIEGMTNYTITFDFRFKYD